MACSSLFTIILKNRLHVSRELLFMLCLFCYFDWQTGTWLTFFPPLIMGWNHADLKCCLHNWCSLKPNETSNARNFYLFFFFFLLQALVGEKACYQSISSYGGQIFYLGTKVSSSSLWLGISLCQDSWGWRKLLVKGAVHFTKWILISSNLKLLGLSCIG